MSIVLRCIFGYFFVFVCCPLAVGKVYVNLPEYPSLNPAGSKIVFSWRGDLWKVSSKGGQAVRLSNDPGGGLRSAWSRDGKRIAFESICDGVPNLYLMNADGTGIRRITKTGRTCLLSGFGVDEKGQEGLTFSSFLEGGRDPSPRPYFISVKGGGARPLHGGFGDSPSISPNGGWVAFTGEGAGRTQRHSQGIDSLDVWLFNRKNDSFIQVTQWKGYDGKAKWGDSRTLFFLSSRKFNCVNLYRTVIGGSPMRVTSFNQNDIQDYSISADGNTAVLMVGNTLYTLDLRKQNAKPLPLKIYVNKGVKVRLPTGSRIISYRKYYDNKAFPYRFGMRKNRAVNGGPPSSPANPIVKKKTVNINNAPVSSGNKGTFQRIPKPNYSQQYKKGFIEENKTENYRDRFESGNYRKNWASNSSKNRQSRIRSKLNDRENPSERSNRPKQNLENQSNRDQQPSLQKPPTPLWRQGYKWLPPKQYASNQPLRISKSLIPLSGQYAAPLTIQSASDRNNMDQPGEQPLSINRDGDDMPKHTHQSVVDLTQTNPPADSTAAKGDALPQSSPAGSHANERTTTRSAKEQTGGGKTVSSAQRLTRNGDSLFERRLYDKAASQYESAMIHAPGDKDIAIRAALSRFAARQYSKAGGTLKKAIGENPDYERLSEITRDLYPSPKNFKLHLSWFSHSKKNRNDSNVEFLDRALSKVKIPDREKQ